MATGVEAATKSPTPPLGIVIVNWNSGSLLRECLAALDRSTVANRLQAIVIDNGSSDGSADRLAAAHLAVEVVHNCDNRGFAAACNQGAALCRPTLLLFLNPDVRVQAATLERAWDYLNSATQAGVGILGVQLLDGEGHVRRTCARRPTSLAMLLQTMFLDRIFPTLVPAHFMIEWNHLETRPVDQVPGAFLMIHREIFEQVGGFDQRYFLYYEDVDLCAAVRAAGFEVVHYSGTAAEHVGAGSTDAIKGRRLFHLLCSRLLYAGKRHGRAATIALMVATLLWELPVRCVHAAWSGGFRSAREIVEAALGFWREVPSLLSRIRAYS